jgi:Tripartite tricarboxylate transporter TctB family
MQRKIIGNLAFEGFLIMVLAWLTWQSHGWARETRLFPYAVGRLALALTVIVFVQEAVGLWRLRKAAAANGEPAQPARPDYGPLDENSPAFIARALRELGWIIGYCAAVGLVGFQAGTFVFLFGYFKIRAEMSWLKALLWAVGSTAVMVLLFVRLASMRPFHGLLWTLWK